MRTEKVTTPACERWLAALAIGRPGGDKNPFTRDAGNVVMRYDRIAFKITDDGFAHVLFFWNNEHIYTISRDAAYQIGDEIGLVGVAGHMQVELK